MPAQKNAKAAPETQQSPAQALYQTLSLCRKAGKLVTGFDAVEEAAVKGKAWIVLYASDASPKTVRRMQQNVGDLVDVLPMPLTQDELAPISRKPAAMYAIVDRSLAALCAAKLEACQTLKNKEEISE